MKYRFILAIILCLSFLPFSAFCAQSNLGPDDIKLVLGFIDLVKKDDAKGIAEMVQYPFERQYPIPTIKNKEEFVARYNEIFDENLKNKIIHSDASRDWESVGFHGIAFDNGSVWIGYNFEINYQTDFEKKERERLIRQQQTIIYPGLKDFIEPTLLWKTKTGVIRVDLIQSSPMGDSIYRLAFWTPDKTQKDIPDMVLKNGEIQGNGTDGSYFINFKDGLYTYQVSVTNCCSDEVFHLEFSISKNNIKIINQEAKEFDFSTIEGLPSGIAVQDGKISVEAGPIWNQADANSKCSEVAKANNAIWDGQWRTTVSGTMSVCELTSSSVQNRKIAVEAGPIWNQADANSKCSDAAKLSNAIWDGQWWTTVPGAMSVCELRFP